jgi:hypothetical protein
VPLSLSDALNSYGFVGQLANAIPELKSILDQAIAGEWVPAQFQRALQDSTWWRTNADAVRQMATLQQLDPATYQQNLHNAHTKINLIAGEMGRTIDGRAVALQALLGNWDDQQIRHFIGLSGTLAGQPGEPDALAGQAAQLQQHMRQLAQNYGVAYTDSFLTGWLRRVQSGADTLDGYESLIQARAKAQYAHLADQIDAGMTVRDIADPFIATYAQTLEVAESAVDLTDPAIQKALQTKGADGTWSTKPMHQFVRDLKDDPRWESTENARQEAYAMVNRLGQDWGFLS